LEAPNPKSEHSCGLAGRSTPGLLVHRSLVRAQVGEPERLERSRPSEMQGLFRCRTDIGGFQYPGRVRDRRPCPQH
jgi:hypothetical protein